MSGRGWGAGVKTGGRASFHTSPCRISIFLAWILVEITKWLGRMSSESPFYLNALSLNGIGPFCSLGVSSEPVALTRHKVWLWVSWDRAGMGLGLTRGPGPWEWLHAEQYLVRVPRVRGPTASNGFYKYLAISTSHVSLWEVGELQHNENNRPFYIGLPVPCTDHPYVPLLYDCLGII